MTIEARAPPSQFVFKLQRTLGGRAGWNGFAFQILFVVALVWIVFEIIANARINLATQRITSGFGFLDQTAGFDVNQSLIAYSGSSSYFRVFLVGLLNTLMVSVIGIFFATIIGFTVALGRLSPNWLLARIAGGYVELIRNLPPCTRTGSGTRAAGCESVRHSRRRSAPAASSATAGPARR